MHLQERFEAFCTRQGIVGVGLFVSPTPAHKSQPVIECVANSSREYHRNREFAHSMGNAVKAAMSFLANFTRIPPPRDAQG